jgi:phospholipase C
MHPIQGAFPARFIEDWRRRRRSRTRGHAPAGMRSTKECASTVTLGTACSTLAAIEHVVIFIQENRSFDHYFGGYRGVLGFSDQSAAFRQPRPFKHREFTVRRIAAIPFRYIANELSVHPRRRP